MGKKMTAISIALVFGVLSVVLTATDKGVAGDDQDWACECILCLSNPGGAKEYKECVPPIDRLERHLERGGRMPKCNGADSKTKYGREDYYTCEESYGPDYKAFTATVNNSGDERMTEKVQVCRKFLGYQRQEVFDGERYHWEDVEVYDTKERASREKPMYCEVEVNGQSTRVYYKKKSSKKGGFF